MSNKDILFKKRNAIAWIMMVSALAIHVLDEALTGFYPFYIETVQSLRDRFGFFPMPTFTFEAWIVGLIIAILILFSLTSFVYRGGRIIRILTIILGFIMVGNALGHMLGSIYLERFLPGFWGSPLLLLTSLYVVFRGFKGGRQN